MIEDISKELKILIQIQEHQVTVFTSKINTPESQSKSDEEFAKTIKKAVEPMVQEIFEDAGSVPPIEIVVCNSPQDAEKRSEMFSAAYLGEGEDMCLSWTKKVK